VRAPDASAGQVRSAQPQAGVPSRDNHNSHAVLDLLCAGATTIVAPRARPRRHPIGVSASNHPVGVVQQSGAQPQDLSTSKGASYASPTPDMSRLLLAVYESEDTAEHVLGVLRAQSEVLSASLDSAATIRLRRDSRFAVIKTEHPRSSTSFWGVFWEVFFGLVFGISDPAPADNSHLAQLFGAIDRAGLDTAFRARVRRALESGNSALAVFAMNWNADASINQVYLRPHACVRAWMSPAQERELLTELGRLPPDDG
jgi:uncharacterized membrane protein